MENAALDDKGVELSVVTADAEVDKEELGLPLASDPPPPTGAARASPGVTRLPIPQGILSPAGWAWLAGGTLFPALSAMVNRVVQVLLPIAPGEEYW